MVAVLSIQYLSKKYSKRQWAIQELNLEIESGDILALSVIMELEKQQRSVQSLEQ